MRQKLSPFACVNALALTLFTGCINDDGQVEEPRISGVYDKNANWSSYHSFDVVEPDAVPKDKHPPRGYQESNRVAVVESIIMQMEARGYMRDVNNPDLLLTPMVRLQDVNVAVPAPWYDYYYGWYWGYGYPWYAEDVITLQAGTLIIDAVDV